MSKYNIEVTSEEIEELMKNVEQKVPISTGWFNPIKKKLALIERKYTQDKPETFLGDLISNVF